VAAHELEKDRPVRLAERPPAVEDERAVGGRGRPSGDVLSEQRLQITPGLGGPHGQAAFDEVHGGLLEKHGGLDPVQRLVVVVHRVPHRPDVRMTQQLVLQRRGPRRLVREEEDGLH